MQEIRSSEVNETKAPEVENYRNIQPENGMTVSEGKRPIRGCIEISGCCM